jgi:hypothetical protein
MKNSTLAIVLGAVLSFGYISTDKPILCNTDKQHKTHIHNYEDLQEKEEFRQNYKLSEGTQVEISNINGVLEVESTNSDVAELYVVRSAKNRKDLEINRIKVEQNDKTFRISTKPYSGFIHNVEIRQRIKLKLPTNVNLTLSDISGRADIDSIQGSLKISDISGQVSVNEATNCQDLHDISGQVSIGKLANCNKIYDISGQVHIRKSTNCQEVYDISGQVDLGLEQLISTGLKVYDVSGNLNLKFANEINADLKAREISGNVNVNMPNLIITNKRDRNNFDARIGSGGTPIVVKDVSGAIHFKQLEAN